MDPKKIKANDNNDMKYREGIDGIYNPDQNEQQDSALTESGQKKEKLEYFTE